jgi:hypothetical protein
MKSIDDIVDDPFITFKWIPTRPITVLVFLLTCLEIIQFRNDVFLERADPLDPGRI